jgi:hypothetical protein
MSVYKYPGVQEKPDTEHKNGEEEVEGECESKTVFLDGVKGRKYDVSNWI